MSFQKRVLLWSSGAHTTDSGFSVANSTDGGSAVHAGVGDSCERHGGENNGDAQARLSPATGKYSRMTGLKWTQDVKAFGVMHSGISNDDDVGGASTGKVVTHDYLKGGPVTRLEHLHFIDCAGFDYMKIYWQGVCLAYEGLAIDTAQVISTATGILVNTSLTDHMAVAAAGMPVVDPSDDMFSIPKMFRMNRNDSLANEGGVGAANFAGTTVFTAATSDACTLTTGFVFNDDVVHVTTTAADLPLGLAINTKYFVVQAAAAGTSCKLSLTSGGAAVDIQDAGTGTHTMHLPGNMPGSGRPRPTPMMWGGGETTANWHPDMWIEGGEPLWVQFKPTSYPSPTTDDWRRYEIVRPALSFELAAGGGGWQSVMQNPNGPGGIFQWGKIYKSANDVAVTTKFTGSGDKFETSCWIGYPNRTYSGSVAASAGLSVLNNGAGPALSITGLQRIVLSIGGVGLSWFGGSASAGVIDQATRATPAGNGASSFLVSTPVGGAAAPREHIRGRLWAVLISNGGGRTF